MRTFQLTTVLLTTAFLLPQCASSSTLPLQSVTAPSWVYHHETSSDELCGIGVAGPGYSGSPYPAELARERALHNLAGTLATEISEAIVDRIRNNITSIELSQELRVDKDLVEYLRSHVTPKHWYDTKGQGPYGTRGFTYALTCVAAPSPSNKPRASPVTALTFKTTPSPDQLPDWFQHTGELSDGRHCAVGHSLPVFFTDQTFQNVIADIRLQLSEVITTLISSYHEDRRDDAGIHIEAVTVASTKAVSVGAIVTHYWFDRTGIGPTQTPGSTYGWGCIYPVDAVRDALVTLVPPGDKTTSSTPTP